MKKMFLIVSAVLISTLLSLPAMAAKSMTYEQAMELPIFQDKMKVEVSPNVAAREFAYRATNGNPMFVNQLKYLNLFKFIYLGDKKVSIDYLFFNHGVRGSFDYAGGNSKHMSYGNYYQVSYNREVYEIVYVVHYDDDPSVQYVGGFKME